MPLPGWQARGTFILTSSLLGLYRGAPAGGIEAAPPPAKGTAFGVVAASLLTAASLRKTFSFSRFGWLLAQCSVFVRALVPLGGPWPWGGHGGGQFPAAGGAGFWGYNQMGVIAGSVVLLLPVHLGGATCMLCWPVGWVPIWQLGTVLPPCLALYGMH